MTKKERKEKSVVAFLAAQMVAHPHGEPASVKEASACAELVIQAMDEEFGAEPDEGT